MSTNDTTAHEETPGSGAIVEPRRIRGRHLVGITAIIVVVVVVGTYLLGRTTASTETRSAEDQQVLEAAVVAQAVEFGDFLLQTRDDFIKEREDKGDDADDTEKEELALAEDNIGYDDVLMEASDDFTDGADLAVQVHEIKDDTGVPTKSEDEPGDEVDDNGFVQVEIGFTSACIDLTLLDKDGPSSEVADGAEISWVTSGPCPTESAYPDTTTTTTTSGDTTTSTTTGNGS
ncbi:MAG: hypothetical protein R3A49_05850 [Acidimicrobiia bacterium]